MLKSTPMNGGYDALMAKLAKLSGKFLFCGQTYNFQMPFPPYAECTRVQYSRAIEPIECTNALWLFPNCVQFLPLSPKHQLVTRSAGPRMARSLFLYFLCFLSTIILLPPGFYLRFFPFFWSNPVLPALLISRGQRGKKSSGKFLPFKDLTPRN